MCKIDRESILALSQKNIPSFAGGILARGESIKAISGTVPHNVLLVFAQNEDPPRLHAASIIQLEDSILVQDPRRDQAYYSPAVAKTPRKHHITHDRIMLTTIEETVLGPFAIRIYKDSFSTRLMINTTKDSWGSKAARLARQMP